MISSVAILSLLCILCSYRAFASTTHGNTSSYSWLINNPPAILETNMDDGMADYRTEQHLPVFTSFVTASLATIDGSVDGEAVDAMEHFFWGQMNGVVLDLGAMDGTLATKSQSFSLEKDLNWLRLLIDGDSSHQPTLLKTARYSYIVSAAICSHHSHVHFANSPNVGGILEFMDSRYLKDFHPDIYDAGKPKGSLTTVKWSRFPHVQSVHCLSLSTALHKSRAKHINFFLLDVKGAELEVLRSINFAAIVFDVLCVETDPKYRPKGFAAQVTAFLEKKGYVNHSGQVGRNTWYVHQDYVPIARPGLDPTCFNGARMAEHAAHSLTNKHLPAFTLCPIAKE